MEDAQTKPPTAVSAPGLTFRRDEDFVSRYANNVQLESSAWDLKLIFGLLDQRDNASLSVEQHTSINLSWPEVKICIHLMQVHLALYEKDNGKVRIPANGLPPGVPEVPPLPFDNPEGRGAFDLVRKMRADFVASLTQP